MSEWKTVWKILWSTMAQSQGPYEIDQIAPVVARELKMEPRAAVREVGFLLEELSRMPAGSRYFRREGNAVVALPEWAEAQRQGKAPQDLYPFEL